MFLTPMPLQYQIVKLALGRLVEKFSRKSTRARAHGSISRVGKKKVQPLAFQQAEQY